MNEITAILQEGTRLFQGYTAALESSPDRAATLAAYQSRFRDWAYRAEAVRLRNAAVLSENQDVSETLVKGIAVARDAAGQSPTSVETASERVRRFLNDVPTYVGVGGFGIVVVLILLFVILKK